MGFRPSRVAGVVAGCLAVAGFAVPAASAQNVTAGDVLTAIEGSIPSWATPQARVGGVDEGATRHIQVALSLSDPAGAARLAKAVSTPGSPQYGQYWTSGQFLQRFAPSQDTVSKVSNWLSTQGLQVSGVSANRHFLDVTAPVSQLEKAFDTQLATYSHRTGTGAVAPLVAPSSPVQVPAAIRSAVTAIVGLDDSARTVQPQHSFLPGTTSNAEGGAAPDATTSSECAAYWNQTDADVPQKYSDDRQSNRICGYRNAQVRSIYGLSAANTGAGQTLAFTGAYNLTTAASDTTRAAASFGGTPLLPGQYNTVLPAAFDHQSECGPAGWGGEQALDLQALHATAPAASYIYYGASSCYTLFDALNTAVSDNKASVVSNSWGMSGEDVTAAERQQLQSITVQAAIQGQALLVSSGDAGDNSGATGKVSADYPATDPWVTAVGGTTVALDGANTVAFTAGWESGGNTQSGTTWVPQSDKDGPFAGGAGGGVSGLYERADYQSRVPNTYGTGKRTIPDVSALADPNTGFAIGYSDASAGYIEVVAGGTSLAAPLVAGLVGDAQQAQQVERLGFLNDALYAQGAPVADVTPVKAGVWTDVMPSFGGVTVPTTRGSYLVDVDAHPQSLQSATGWDPVTGIGTPTSGFVTRLGH
jgi:subtilase family serine protease